MHYTLSHFVLSYSIRAFLKMSNSILHRKEISKSTRGPSTVSSASASLDYSKTSTDTSSTTMGGAGRLIASTKERIEAFCMIQDLGSMAKRMLLSEFCGPDSGTSIV